MIDIFEKHLDLVQRTIAHGTHSLTPEERVIIRQGKPEPGPRASGYDRIVDEVWVREDLRAWGRVLGWL